MFTSITHSSIYVLDQDEAIDFYVGKLGFEINTDVDLGFMRWLTINLPGEPEHEVLLEVPGEPAHDPETAAQMKDLLAKGALSGAMIFRTDDCRKTYEELLAKGVEFTQPPVERFYGTDCGMRDPFGNNLRFTEPAAGDVTPPPPEELEKQFAQS